MSTTHSSLLQTAIQNLHVSQQAKDRQARTSSDYGSPQSDRLELESEDEEGDEFVNVGQGTRPPTRPASPKPKKLGLREVSRLSESDGETSTDPLVRLPTLLAVRVLLQLDIKTLARCERVCKKWKKSSTLNHVWYLQNRALLIPDLPKSGEGGKNRKLDDEVDFFDPYDKTPRLSALPTPRMPSSSTLVWTKNESKVSWKTRFQQTFKRSDPDAEPEYDPLRVDIASLHSSGASTPSGRHTHAGSGSGNASRWAEINNDNDEESMTPTERKVAARKVYKSMGGRKARSKRKMGGQMGTLDRGGGGADEDDPRFNAPF